MVFCLKQSSTQPSTLSTFPPPASPLPSLTSALSPAPQSHHGLELLPLTLPACHYPQLSHLILGTKTPAWRGRG